MTYITNFLIALPSTGWGVLAVLLLLWFLLHSYEGYIMAERFLESHAEMRPRFLDSDTIKRIKRLFKPSLLFVAAVMAVVALLSPVNTYKNEVDKLPLDAAQLETLDAEKASKVVEKDGVDRVPQPKQRDLFVHALKKEKE